MNTPEVLTQHQHNYKNNAWQDYTVVELGNWVHLFVKRASHRNNVEKAKKDLDDAQNYLAMIQAHIDEARKTHATV